MRFDDDGPDGGLHDLVDENLEKKRMRRGGRLLLLYVGTLVAIAVVFAFIKHC